MSNFNERHYNADFTGDPKPGEPGNEWSDALRKETYIAKNRVNRDAYAIALGGGTLDFVEDDEESLADGDPTPAYLATAEYKAALSWYRSHIDAGTTETSEGKAARNLVESYDEQE